MARAMRAFQPDLGNVFMLGNALVDLHFVRQVREMHLGKLSFSVDLD